MKISKFLLIILFLFTINIQNLLADDVKMIKAAGIGVSFNGKNILQKSADVIFNHTSLKGVLYIQGIKENEISKVI